ncbi:MAG: DUF302 domain-containing protein [Victivallales bacterium]|nr:DUF302 domain-containing protein [Victivallales bacterium]
MDNDTGTHGEVKGEKRRMSWGSFIAGLLWGITLAFVFGVIYLRHSIIPEYRSSLGFDDTVSAIMQSADRLPGWTPKFSSSCPLPKTKDGTRVAVIQLCNPKHAAELLDNDHSRKAAAVIPCTFAVYEKSDGTTYVSMLDASSLGTILGGRAGGIFSTKIAPEHQSLLKALMP